MEAFIAYAESVGFSVKKQGRTFGSCRCPKCGDASDTHSNKMCIYTGRDGKARWCCHACGNKGDLADFISAVEGIGLRDALQRSGQALTRTAPAQAEAVGASPATKTASSAFLEVSEAIFRKAPTWDPAVVNYLMGRGLSKDTILLASQMGLIRMLPANPSRARAMLIEIAGGAHKLVEAGFWNEGSKWPPIAFRPLIGFLGGWQGMEFRQIEAKNEHPKSIRYGVLSKPYTLVQDKKEVVVCEGLIDLLSLMEIGEKRTIMALPGINAWRQEWFKAAHAAYGTKFYIATDDDDAGNTGANQMLEFCAQNGIPAERMFPSFGKDWNDDLMAMPDFKKTAA